MDNKTSFIAKKSLDSNNPNQIYFEPTSCIWFDDLYGISGEWYEPYFYTELVSKLNQLKKSLPAKFIKNLTDKDGNSLPITVQPNSLVFLKCECATVNFQYTGITETKIKKIQEGYFSNIQILSEVLAPSHTTLSWKCFPRKNLFSPIDLINGLDIVSALDKIHTEHFFLLGYSTKALDSYSENERLEIEHFKKSTNSLTLKQNQASPDSYYYFPTFFGQNLKMVRECLDDVSILSLKETFRSLDLRPKIYSV